METGKKYKLADECITPGGRNTTRDEDAIIEAKKYYRNDIKRYDAFLHGVEWAEKQIANVWHDASEEPKLDQWFLAQIGDNAFDTFIMAMDKNKEWRNWCKGINLKRWAYVSDLLPKGGEK